jgi:hypothetical protein
MGLDSEHVNNGFLTGKYKPGEYRPSLTRNKESIKIEDRLSKMPQPIQQLIFPFFWSALGAKRAYNDYPEIWKEQLLAKKNMLNGEIKHKVDNGHYKNIAGLSAVGDIFYDLLVDRTYWELDEACNAFRISLQPKMTTDTPREKITYSLKNEAEYIKSHGQIGEDSFKISKTKPRVFTEKEIVEIERYLQEEFKNEEYK